MTTYEITIQFKNNTLLEFKIDSEKDLKKSLSTGWEDEDVFRIGDYFIVVNEILWIRVTGEKLVEKHSGNKLQDTGKEIK